jgi:hypothetical protein
MEAVDRFFSRIAEDQRLKAHGLEKLRQDLLLEATEFYKRIVPEAGYEPQVEAERANNFLRLANLTRELGRPDESASLSREAEAIFLGLSTRFPTELAYRMGVARARDSLGQDLGEDGDVPAAHSTLMSAAGAWEQLASERPGHPEFTYQTAATLCRMGKLLFLSVEQAAECEEILGRCLKFCDNLDHKNPQSPRYRDLRAEALLFLGGSRSYRDFDSARELLEAGLKLREELAGEQPENSEFRSRLVSGCLLIATSYSNARVKERIPQLYERIKSISERLAREHPDIPFFAENHSRIGTIHAVHTARQTRDHVQASKLAEEALAWAPASGLALIYGACAFCECSEAARQGADLDPSRSAALADRYLTRAMELLGKARNAGLFRQQVFIEALKSTDPDLAPLRGRDEFKRFVAELEREAGRSK